MKPRVRWRGAPGTSRRAFLGGAAATLALPWLPSLEAGAASAPPKRLVWWFVPNGLELAGVTPSAVGPLGTLPPTLEPLAAIQDRMLVLTGMRHATEGAPELAHMWGTSTWLSGVLPRMNEVRNGRSFDQLAADTLGQDTAFRSLQLGIDGAIGTGSCNKPGWTCLYQECLSWADAETPLPQLTDPRVLFDRLFAGSDPGATEAERIQRRAWRGSVLDAVLADANDLKPGLGTDDRSRLDGYLTAVRELEQRVAQLDQGVCLPDGSVREVAVDDVEVRTDLFSELIAMALSCGLTRVVTFAQGNSESNRSHDFLGVSGGHHALSHHAGDPDKIAALQVIARWEMERFVQLIHRLAAQEEGSGTLLDNTLVMLGTEFSNGDGHITSELPAVVVGGPTVGGRHVRVGERALADLHLELLQTAGVPVSGLPGATAPLGVLEG